MHIWLISAFEPTPADNTRPMRFMGIANAAVARWHKVTFFTSTFRHSSKTHRFTEDTRKMIVKDQYELVLIHSQAYKKNISVERLMAHRHLAERLMDTLKKENTFPDVIFISIPPLGTTDAVCKWAKQKGIPVIIDIIDPWPDVFLKGLPAALRSMARIPLYPFYSTLKNIMDSCTAVTAISSEYIDWIQRFSKREKKSAFFLPAVQFDEVKSAFAGFAKTITRDEGKLKIVYAGSLAGSYDIPAILGAAGILSQKYPGKTMFYIAGTGPQETLVRQKMAIHDNIEYLGWLSQEEMYKIFYQSDLGLTQHTADATQSVTYKLFDYLSAGLPILNSLNSEMAAIITDNHLGLYNKSGDAQALATNIEQFLKDKNMLNAYKENALRFTAEHGDAKIVYGELVHFMEQQI
jgi:glycosyltransferase involved in cell wall biosynthesis